MEENSDKKPVKIDPSLDSPDSQELEDSWSRSFWEKTKDKSSVFTEKFKEKYQENVPMVKEKSKQAWKKTKQVSKKVALATSAKIRELKERLNNGENEKREAFSDTGEKVSISKVLEKSDFNVDDLDFENNLYVIHQTHSEHVDSILRSGLRTNAGLNWTANWWDKENIIWSLFDMEQGRGHKGSDALVIMEFPKEKFKTKEKITLDDISELLTESWESQNFEVPSQYIKTVVRVEKQ